ncbi:hypothetical protein AB205_0094820 [Aquarana catesbeiana]|uniref:Uncharacterized protein n=1 Tax=Aquarana catesbeiana TaxID=8400 RepID=A0A2G9R521_AQUCT|nr:hypothetical protein AB205_0094820 [Aquarana catesbeiana]
MPPAVIDTVQPDLPPAGMSGVWFSDPHCCNRLTSFPEEANVLAKHVGTELLF